MAKWYENPEGKSEVGEYRDALPTPGTAPGKSLHGRGAAMNPGNRFETVRLHVLGDYLDQKAAEADEDETSGGGSGGKIPTQVFHDKTRKIINSVQHPEIVGFDWTLNPYRGCEHGCVYCYARPYHEYLGFSSGIDFETKIMAKLDAAALLREELGRASWKAEPLVMSGITDCWQPIEMKLRITRACLEVLSECGQPVSMLTRSRRILRDLDLISSLANRGAAAVAVTITTLDHKLSSVMEPRASSPADRLATVKALAAAGVPVTAMIAPVIPGLTDTELPALLRAISEAGATGAGLCMIRLPYQNKAMFLDWLRRELPERASHVESQIRDVFDGKLYDANAAMRRNGQGAVAGQIRDIFHVFRKRYGLDREREPLSNAHFRRPSAGGQMALF